MHEDCRDSDRRRPLIALLQPTTGGACEISIIEMTELRKVHFICELDALAFSTGIARPCLEREGSVQGETRTPRRRWGVSVRVL